MEVTFVIYCIASLGGKYTNMYLADTKKTTLKWSPNVKEAFFYPNMPTAIEAIKHLKKEERVYVIKTIFLTFNPK